MFACPFHSFPLRLTHKTIAHSLHNRCPPLRAFSLRPPSFLPRPAQTPRPHSSHDIRVPPARPKGRLRQGTRSAGPTARGARGAAQDVPGAEASSQGWARSAPKGREADGEDERKCERGGEEDSRGEEEGVG